MLLLVVLFLNYLVVSSVIVSLVPGGSHLSSRQIIGGSLVSAVVGGTASVISGGKFSNSDRTAAFQYLYNQAYKSFPHKVIDTHKQFKAWFQGIDRSSGYQYIDGIMGEQSGATNIGDFNITTRGEYAIAANVVALAVGGTGYGIPAIGLNGLAYGLDNSTANGLGLIISITSPALGFIHMNATSQTINILGDEIAAGGLLMAIENTQKRLNSYQNARKKYQ